MDSSDTRSCAEAIKILGAEIKFETDRWIVQGTSGSINPISDIIDVGNSGTTLYLAAGLAALGTHKITFTGDNQIQTRPVGNLLKSLKDLGAKINISGKVNFNWYNPIRIEGNIFYNSIWKSNFIN